MRQIRVEAPGSGANCGLFFDHAGVAYSFPTLGLHVQLHENSHRRNVHSDGISGLGPDRQPGRSGALALDALLRETDNDHLGYRLLYRATHKLGYPSGGTGSSGAEAAAAVVAADSLLDLRLTDEAKISYASMGEAGRHLDNVAPAVLGGMVFIDQQGDQIKYDHYDPPKGLGLLLGLSSHVKAGGTAQARMAVKDPLPRSLQEAQDARVAAAKQALVAQNITSFIQLICTDEFHEPRRADAGVYGNFKAADLRRFRKALLDNFGMAVTVSGAGPNMQFWYDQRSNWVVSGQQHVNQSLQRFVSNWFTRRRMSMRLTPISIAREGAHVVPVSKIT